MRERRTWAANETVLPKPIILAALRYPKILRTMAAQMTKPLQHVTFLVTRPIHQSENLRSQIVNAGGMCILFPTITITPLNQRHSLSLFNHQFSQINKIIFTSSNAVAPVLAYWPVEMQKQAIFAIGPGTAATLANAHIPATIPAGPAFNSQSLLDLPELQQINKQQIVIFKGIGGNELLANTLRQRGAGITEIAVYQRSRPTTTLGPYLSAWQKHPIDCIISTSEESLENLQAMAENDSDSLNWLHQQQLLLISPRMQASAQKLGFKKPSIIANNASDSAILTAALSLANRKQ